MGLQGCWTAYHYSLLLFLITIPYLYISLLPGYIARIQSQVVLHQGPGSHLVRDTMTLCSGSLPTLLAEAAAVQYHLNFNANKHVCTSLDVGTGTIFS